MPLSAEQVDALLRPIRPHRVLQAEGQSHVPAYDVAAHLTRVFGFGGWDKQILSLNLVCEDIRPATQQGKRDLWVVTYACTMRLIVKDSEGNKVASWDDGACGTANLPQKGEAHDMALKSSVSYALKRCAAFGLGDQFGLSLYNKGQMSALIGKTLVMPETENDGYEGDLEAHIQAPQSLGNDETDYGRPYAD